jgi:hypothetical protein
MARRAVLTKKKRGDGVKALVYHVHDTLWGWWCPECTGDEGPIVSRESYSNRGNAQRGAVDHERAEHGL